MRYRTFGRLEFAPSALGFGAMRLPVHSDASGKPDYGAIDDETATKMLRRAVDAGLNYVDTAYVYHEGESERWLGRALQNGYRERVKIATKMPVWLVRKASDFDRILDEQLDRLRVESIDFYLLHGLDERLWEHALETGQLRSAKRALEDGRIRHLGFSFHDRYEAFARILAASELWEFCQIQLNYMDEEYQAGRAGLELAAAHGLGVTVMEPLRGGMLARTPWSEVQAAWMAAGTQRTPVEWALQWVWSLPEVSLVLSGMSTLEQVEENLTYAGRSRPGLLSASDLAVVRKVRDIYLDMMPVRCTACRYCMPCPRGVVIPDILALYNDAHVYGNPEHPRLTYAQDIEENERAGNCISCRRCEKACPQHIAIATWMDRAEKFFTEQ